MRQRDYVAAGLTVLTIVGVAMTRVPSAEATPQLPVDPNLQKARDLINTVKAQAANLPPEQRVVLALELETVASRLEAESPQAAAELRAAAREIRGTGPGPGPTTDPILAQAREIIRQIETTAQASNAPPAQRELLAQQLEAAAGQFQSASPQAADELRAAATRMRGGARPAPPPPPDTDVEQARMLIDYLEAQTVNTTPQQREAIAVQLDAAAAQTPSPQAASELRASAARVRSMPGPSSDLEQARLLINALQAQAMFATPEQRQGLATQLDNAANAARATNPQAADELKAAATRMRGGVGGGVVPRPSVRDELRARLAEMLNRCGPTPTGPATKHPCRSEEADSLAGQLYAVGLLPEAKAARDLSARLHQAQSPPSARPILTPLTPALIQRYDALKAKGDAYIADQTGTVAMDVATLGAMDDTAAELAALGDNLRAQTLVNLATAGYQKRGLQRPMARTL